MRNCFESRFETAAAIGWTVVIVALLILFLTQLRSGVRLQTNILELMPASEQDPVFETSRSAFEGTMGKTVLLLLEPDSSATPPSAEQMKKARERVRSLLHGSDVFKAVRGVNLGGGRAFFDLYFPHRYRILAPSVRSMLKSDQPFDKLEENIRRGLHRQTMPLSSKQLKKDPLLLFPALVRHWSDLNSNDSTRQGRSASGTKKLVIGRLAGDPLEPPVQRSVKTLIDRCRVSVKEESERIRVRWTGLVRLAKVSRNRMKNDASFIGFTSLVGVVLLVFVAFRTLRHLLLLVVTVSAGLLCAFSISSLLFDLHMVTLAFGATLIGISVDYAFHYFCNHAYGPAEWTPVKGLRQIFPGITFGLITSVIAFASLAFTPLPALRQISFFTCVGLAGAYLTVVAWFPVLFRWTIPAPTYGRNENHTSSFIMYPVDQLLAGWSAIGRGAVSPVLLTAVALGVGAVLLAGFYHLQFNDDIETLAQIPEDLLENDRYIREASGIKNTGRYILVEGATKQELLRHQQAVHQRLDRLKSEGALGGYWGVGQFLPSFERQKEDVRLLRNTLLSEQSRLEKMLLNVGYRSEIAKRVPTAIRDASDSESYLTVPEWLNHPASFGMRQLWLGCSNGRCSSLIILKRLRDESRVERTFQSMSFAHYRNRKRAFTRVMREYRVRSIRLATVAYVLILLFLLLRYGLTTGLLMFLPSSVGSLLVIATLSLWGVSFQLMHVLAVLIILGMGIDYTIFLVEESRHGKSIRPTMMALFLSAFTTVLSFGCLAFSQAAVIHSIGIIVFPGILLILLLSPMVCTSIAHEQ